MSESDHIEELLAENLSGFTIVNNEEILSAVMQDLKLCREIFLDVEAVRMRRVEDEHGNGKTCLFQIGAETDGDLHVYLFDLIELPSAAVHLKPLLEDGNVRKLIWDCRLDCDVLHHQFGIAVNNLLDVQLLDVYLQRVFLRRKAQKRRGLMKCVEDDKLVKIGPVEDICQAYKQMDKADVDDGRHWSVVWAERPLTSSALQYAVGDVALVHHVYSRCFSALAVDLEALLNICFEQSANEAKRFIDSEQPIEFNYDLNLVAPLPNSISTTNSRGKGGRGHAVHFGRGRGRGGRGRGRGGRGRSRGRSGRGRSRGGNKS